MVEDIFAQFSGEIEPAEISPQDLQISKNDWGLFEQIRSNPKLSDIRNEIALNRLMQGKVLQEITSLIDLDREHLVGAIVAIVRGYLEVSSDVEEDLRHELRKVLPVQHLPLKHVEQFSKLLERGGKLVETQKRIIEGIQVNVNVDASVIGKLFSHVIRPAIPVEYWPAVLAQARKYAALTGGAPVLALEPES